MSACLFQHAIRPASACNICRKTVHCLPLPHGDTGSCALFYVPAELTMRLYLVLLAGHSRSSTGLVRSSSAVCLVLTHHFYGDHVKLLCAAQDWIHARWKYVWSSGAGPSA